jgi:hypothetical protein
MCGSGGAFGVDDDGVLIVALPDGGAACLRRDGWVI